MEKENVIVVGNGPSLKEIDYSKLPKDFDVFRTNTFFMEDKYYLGKKAKMVVIWEGIFLKLFIL